MISTWVRFNPRKESHCLQYLDAHNCWLGDELKLPTGRFEWVKNPEKLKDNISKLDKEAGKGYVLEVDVFYPDDLNDMHNDLQLMCEKRMIIGVQKLVLNLYDKKKYAIHITALDQAFKHGLVLNKVHQVTEFDQSAWLAPYIDFNTQL